MIDRDFSFIRLRDNISDAFDLNESKGAELSYSGQIHLIPNETYLQISNSPTPINLSTWNAKLVNCNDEVLEDCTNNIFIEPFTDENGIEQIVFEFINTFELYGELVSLRFEEESNGDKWYSNPFLSTSIDSEKTMRFDYKSSGEHYGTQYQRADFYQSIRLDGYYRNDINESERPEYHQISNDITRPVRNIDKEKERYILDDFSGFTSRRLEKMLSSDYIYLDGVRTYSTNPLEYVEPESDSNISQHEMIVSKDYSQEFTFEYQIYDGLELTTLYPADNGYYTLTSIDSDILMLFNTDISIEEGTLIVYDASDDSVVVSYDQNDIIQLLSNDVTIQNVLGTGNDVGANGEYYIKVSSGLIRSTFGELFEGIDDTTTWNFTITVGDYDSADYDNIDYLTN